MTDVSAGFRPPCWCPSRWAPAWRLHTNLYKFWENVSPHIFRKKNCCDLNLGESLCISTLFLFPDSRLDRLNGFYFDLFWMAWHWKPAILPPLRVFRWENVKSIMEKVLCCVYKTIFKIRVNLIHHNCVYIISSKHTYRPMRARAVAQLFYRPLQKRERTGKEYGCFPFVWKTKIFKWKINYILESLPRIEVSGGGKWQNGSSTNVTQNRVWIG